MLVGKCVLDTESTCSKPVAKLRSVCWRSFPASHLLLEGSDWLLLGLNILFNDLVVLNHICTKDMWVALVTLNVAGNGWKLLDLLPMSCELWKLQHANQVS